MKGMSTHTMHGTCLHPWTAAAPWKSAQANDPFSRLNLGRYSVSVTSTKPQLATLMCYHKLRCLLYCALPCNVDPL